MLDGDVVAVMHIEGAEAVDAELEMLPALHAFGLRSLGITWSRPNAFGYGVLAGRRPARGSPTPAARSSARARSSASSSTSRTSTSAGSGTSRR